MKHLLILMVSNAISFICMDSTKNSMGFNGRIEYFNSKV